MTTHDHEHNHPSPSAPASSAIPPTILPEDDRSASPGIGAELAPTLDRLIARIVDAEADDHDWRTFKTLAGTQALAWKHLACAQRDASLLTEAVRPALDASERVRLPRPTAHAAIGSTSEPGLSTRRSLRNVARGRAEPDLRRIGGWAIAAVIGLAWIGSALAPAPRTTSPANNTASLVPAGWTINTPEDAVRAYLDVGSKSGRVLGEMPDRVIVRTTPTGGSTDSGQPQQVEVIYLRQFVERTVISEFFELGSDEFGRPVPIRLSIPPQPRPESWQ